MFDIKSLLGFTSNEEFEELTYKKTVELLVNKMDEHLKSMDLKEELRLSLAKLYKNFNIPYRQIIRYGVFKDLDKELDEVIKESIEDVLNTMFWYDSIEDAKNNIDTITEYYKEDETPLDEINDLIDNCDDDEIFQDYLKDRIVGHLKKGGPMRDFMLKFCDFSDILPYMDKDTKNEIYDRYNVSNDQELRKALKEEGVEIPVVHPWDGEEFKENSEIFYNAAMLGGGNEMAEDVDLDINDVDW